MHALRAGQLFDGSAFVGPSTVLVDGERIVGVEHGHPDLPDGTPVTAYDGTVLPGLFDCHVHLVADSTPGGLERTAEMSDEALDGVIRASLAAQVGAGVTTVRDLGDRHYRTLGMRALPGLPRVVTAGPPVTTPGGHCHYLGGEVDGVGAARAAVAEHVERGVDVIKVMASGGMLTAGTDSLGTQLEPGTLRAVVEAAHSSGLEVLAHAHSLAGIRHALACGVDGIEHFTGLTEEGVRVPDEVLSAVAASGTRVCPTVGGDETMIPPHDLLPPGLRTALDRLGLTLPGLFDALREQLSRVREHGVVVVTGTDAGISASKAHGNVRFAIYDLVSAGYPVADALATATSGAAASCGLSDVTGALRPGLAADLLVVDGDLASDVEALGRPVSTTVRGTPTG
jgi:imidazolonepropionase-like amidohydrolase